ncbi:hypothetical protein J4H92_10770 [Leucobacter weissii]|uniref:Ig-like domain-containing protein n=1 Tax=Leucobacter weissii TaxID=1983706 RepID=A0A939MM65_9MICO|nr:hypothetical protein [Leucobacter weissii]MBO1902430.1 hypothetical protein [Leucobacter weissii]
MSGRTRAGRTITAVFATGLIGATFVLAPASAASAAEIPVTTVDELEDAFGSAAQGDTIVLAPGFPDEAPLPSALTLEEGRALTIDLGGNAVTLTGASADGAIRIASGANLTVTGAGSLNMENSTLETAAVSGSGALTVDAATVTATGSGGRGYDTPNATGGHGGAGIEGDVFLSGGARLTATGGGGGHTSHLFSTSGNGGPGIGGSATVGVGSVLVNTGGYGGPAYGTSGATAGSGAAAVAGTLTVGGGTVTLVGGARGVANATQVNGQPGPAANGSVSVTGGGQLTASSGSPVGSAFGPSSAVTVGTGSALTVAQSGWALGSDVTSTNAGVIRIDGALTGGGTLVNHGILVPRDEVTAAVTVNNYRLTFAGTGASPVADQRVYAPTLASVERLWPVPDAPDAHTLFLGWTTDGVEGPVEDGTPLSSISENGAAALEAEWTGVTIAGEATVGTTLTAELSGGLGDETFQWTVDGDAVAGATGTTFTPGLEHIGTTIGVTVGAGDLVGYASVPPSIGATTGPVQGAYSYGPVIIEGDPRVDRTLTADITGAFDPPNSVLEFQWSTAEADGSGGWTTTPIDGATEDTFTPGAALLGERLIVEVTPTLPFYPLTPISSDPTEPIGAADFASLPEVTVEGDAIAGATLTASLSGSFAPEAAIAYQWFLDGAPVDDADQATWELPTSAVGAEVFLEVTGTRAGYTDSPVRSNALGPIQGEYSYGPVVIEGNARVDSILTANITGAFDPPNSVLEFQWLTAEADGSGGWTTTAIAGATEDTFTPDAALLGERLIVQVTPTLPLYPLTPLSSEPTEEIGAAAFSSLPQVTVEGDAIAGTTLTSTLSGGFAPEAAVAHQWFLDGAPVSGADQPSWRLPADAIGHEVFLEVTGTRAGYDGGTVRSDVLGTVQGEFQASEVVVTGTPRAGETLTADASGSFDPEPDEFAYQWTADGAPIDGATDADLKLGDDHVGAAVRVVVTGTKSDYLDAVAASEPLTIAAAESPILTVSSDDGFRPGGTIRIEGAEFPADGEFDLELHSRPVLLATATASAVGDFSTEAQIPSTTTPGAHRIVAVDSNGAVVAEAAIRVGEPLAEPDATPDTEDPGTADPLARAGASPWMGALAVSALAVLAGLTLLLAPRVRRTRR